MNRHRIPTRRPLALLLGASLLAGCAVGPDYQPPQAEVPAQWSNQEQKAPATGETARVSDQELGRWWETFRDSTLTALEKRALKSNLDLKLAAARIEQARALRLMAGASLGPGLEATSQFRQSRSLASPLVTNGGAATIGNQFQAGFDASWELDLFGGGRRGVEAADADLLAAAQASLSAQVSLTAEVARDYLELRALQQGIITTKGEMAAEEQTVELTRQLFKAGFNSRLDVETAEAQLANRRALLPPLQAAAQQAMHGLAILLGQAPEALTAELSPTAALPEPPATPPAGLPSDLLRRRPDIRQAEANIHAATARIGVAEADLFPKLNLTGAISLQGDAINSWFNWTNRLWSLGPSASWQLFDSGRIRANVMQQQSIKNQSLIAYRQTVLSALQEVEDALVAVNREREHQQALRQAREADQRALNLARDLYTAGQTDFTSVLLAEQTLYTADDALTQSTKALATNLVALYKALGGGWQTSG